MGNSSFTCGGAPGHLEEGVATEVDDVTKQATDAIKQEVIEAAEDFKEQVTQIAVAPAKAVESIAENVAELAEDVKEQAEEVKEEAGQVAEAAKGVTEQVISTIDAAMDAAVAAVTGTMIVDFADEKGTEQQVTFKTRKLGFELGMSGGSCCRAKGQAKVVAKKVTKGSQAEALGVKRGWRVKSANGLNVTGLQQGKKLLEDLALKLPEA